MAIDSAFKQAEDTFQKLKSQLRSGEISRREFLDELKKLQLKDDQGRLWMIGSQSGKWYYLKGKDWVQSEPPSAKETKTVCPYCGFENKPGAAICARCGGGIGEYADVCPKCGAKLVPPLYECPECGKQDTIPRTTEVATAPLPQDPASAAAPRSQSQGGRVVLVARGIKAGTSFFFGGTLCLLVGILVGAFIGATGALSNVVATLPAFFVESQGKLLGAIVFAATTGILGFLFLGVFFFLFALLTNLILSLTGGVKVEISVEGSPAPEPVPAKTAAKESLLDI